MTTDKPAIKPALATTYHRDGTVSYWSVYAQGWRRAYAHRINARDFEAMTEAERARIERMSRAAALNEVLSEHRDVVTWYHERDNGAIRLTIQDRDRDGHDASVQIVRDTMERGGWESVDSGPVEACWASEYGDLPAGEWIEFR